MNDLIELVSECLEIDAAEIKMDFEFKNHPKWDSLAALSLITGIEDNFGLVLSDSDLKKFDSIQKLSEFVMEHSRNK